MSTAKIVRIGAGVLTVAVIVVAVWMLAGDRSSQPRAASAPSEYLYLDNDRVRAYLGQIEGGLSRSEEHRITQSDKTEAGVNVPQASVAGSSQRESYVRRVVTPGDADRFYSLRGQLDDHGWLRHLDATQPKAFMRAIGDVRSGDFVEISGARLRIPSFAAVFAKANYADQLVAHGQHRVPSRLLAPLSSDTRAKLAEFIQHVGKNPRLPFRLTIPPGPGVHAHVFMPLLASRVSYQPGLAAGSLRVIAKVLQAIPQPDGHADARQPTAGTYLDAQTFTSFGRALQNASPVVLHRLDIVPGDRRRGIRAIVRRAARVTGPGLVLLPIAVFE